MLPDFVSVKLRRQKLIQDKVAQIQSDAPVTKGIPSFQQHEGLSIRFYDVHGHMSRRDYSSHKISSSIRISEEELTQLDHRGLDAKILSLGNDLSSKAEQQFLAYVDSVCESAGTSVSAGGSPLSWEMFLDALRNTEVDFARDGRPILPTVVMHPDSAEQFDQSRWAKDSEFQQAYHALMEQKWIEWRDREADRKLA